MLNGLIFEQIIKFSFIILHCKSVYILENKLPVKQIIFNAEWISRVITNFSYDLLHFTIVMF